MYAMLHPRDRAVSGRRSQVTWIRENGSMPFVGSVGVDSEPAAYLLYNVSMAR
jgi:hypothetical protein